MKINFNRNYTIIALYALVVILCGVLFVFAFSNFGAVWKYIVNFFSIFMPIFYGMFIAYLIYPMIKFFERRVFRGLLRKKRYGLARALSLVCVFLILIVSIVLFCWLILPHIIEGYVDLQKRSSVYIEDMKTWLFSLAEDMGELSGYVTKLMEYFIGLMENFYAYIVGLFPDIMTLAPVLISFVTDFFLGVVLSIYFILAKEKLHAQMKKMLRAFFNTEKYRFIYRSARLADRNFGGYIKGQIADSIIVGILSYICLMVIGVPYFPLISTIMGFANLIPVVGLLLGIVVGALIIFLANPHAVIWFALLMLVLHIINAKMIRPYIIRVGVDASTMFMFAAIIIMTGLIGFWGLMIGVPVFVILYTVLHSEVDKRLGKKGLSTEQADYYETVAGKELYREREYKRMRRMRGSKKKEEVESDEDFIIKKPNLEDTMEVTACADTMEMNLYKDTAEMKLYKEKISEKKTDAYQENPKENMISK
ncbi:MAG: AI-2E family transporter [Ruminococcaceae bacterium]|nr:AI-2E family transporter [Oscillospiraceae bacterium]